MSGSTTTYRTRYRITGTTAWSDWSAPTTNWTSTINGLTPNTTYDIEVLATNSLGNVESSIVTVTTGAVAPQQLDPPIASNITYNSVVLNWSPPQLGSAPFTYQVQQSNDNGTTWSDVGLPVTTLSTLVTGLSAATTYEFRIQASNGSGSTTSGATTVVTLSSGQIPSAPTGLTLTNIQATQATLSWTPATGTAPISYQARYRVNGTSTWTNSGSAITTTSATITGLTAATSYDFQVVASNTFGSTNSGILTASTSAALVVPGTPGTPTASNITGTGMTLSWTASATGTAPISYQLQYRQHGASAWQNVGAASASLTANITGLSVSTAYDFQVKATNSAGSTTSGIATITTIAGTQAPSAPSGLTFSSVGPNSLVLSWTASTGTAPITYQPQYRLTGGSTWTNTPTTTTTSASITGLTANTSYDFQVVASNATGSATSTVVAKTTAAGTSTWDPAEKSANVALTNNNMTAATNSTTRGSVRSTSHQSTGKQYLEIAYVFAGGTGAMAVLADPASTNTQIKADGSSALLTSEPAAGSPYIGFANVSYALGNVLGSDSHSVGIDTNGDVWVANVKVASTGMALGPSGTMRLALDFDFSPPRLWFALSGGAWSSGSTQSLGPTGSQNTGSSNPVISGPASYAVASSIKTAISDITVSDTNWPQSGTDALNVSCTNGTVWMTLNGVAVAGSGTTTINATDTDTNIQAMLASLMYGAPASGTDTLVVNIWDEQGFANTLNVPITIVVQQAGDPATATAGIALSGIGPGAVYAAYTDTAASGDSVTINFGATALTYAVPTGYTSWDPMMTGTTIAPGPMSAPTTTGITAGSITVNWTAPTTGTTPFNYQPAYRKTGDTSWIPFGSPITANTTVTVTGLTAGTGYDFQITASNGAGSSTSPTVSATTTSASSGVGQVAGSQQTGTTDPIISGPVSGTAQISSPLNVTGITFQDSNWPMGGTVALHVSCTLGVVTMMMNGSPVTGSGTASIQYNDSSANAQTAIGTLVYTAPSSPGNDSILVNLWDQMGNQNTLSISISIVNNPGAPGAVTLTSGTVTQNSIALAWSAASGNSPINYAVEYRVSGTANWSTSSTTTSTSATVGGLSASTSYDFRIVSSNSIGTATSNSVTAQTANPTTSVPGDATGPIARRIAEIEIFGVNCFPDGQDGSSASGTNSASAHITALSYIVGNSGLGMFNRIYANSTGLDVPFITSICQSLPNMKWTSCLNYSTSSVPVLQAEEQSALVSNGYLIAVEGYNEPDNPGVQSGNVAVPVATCLSGQQTIYGTGHPLGLSVMLPSVTDDASNTYETDYFGSSFNTFLANADWCNGHSYLNNGPPNNANFERQADYLASVTGKPAAVTEFHPLLYNASNYVALGEQAAAYYTAIALLTGIVDHKLKALQWYCLYDYTGFSPNVGLFRGFDPTNPTLTAQMMKAIYQLTGDPGSGARHTFQPNGLIINKTGLPAAASFSTLSGGRIDVFQNSAGKFFVFIRNEQLAPGGTASPVTLTFSGARTMIVQYNLTANPATAMTPVQTVTPPNSTSITIQLAAEVHLLVIDF